ncbi:MAG: DUF559 domain-containing protein [Patescibacteria group bacterium]|nr:DUF559 domain-containing protein [Patescibacteria group bacterium]
MEIHKKELVPLSKSLRHRQTPWESNLWKYLRANRFCGFKFKRQVIIGEYIVDFCCNEKKLIIELDGSQHNDETKRKYDMNRSKYLASFGYRVLRFWNNDVDSNIEGILDTIKRSTN